MSEAINKVCVNIQQNFSEAQKAQARANIGAAAEGSAGSYSAGDGVDITNNVISAKVDGTSITVNASGELESHAVISGYTTYNVDWSNPYTHSFTVTQDDINRGYFDGILEFATQADVTVDIVTATRVALGWDVWWAGGQTTSRISSVDFSIGASVDTVWQGLFSDNAPAHEFHKDWTLIPGYLVHTRYNRIRMRCHLTSSAEVGDTFQIEVTGLVEQQR